MKKEKWKKKTSLPSWWKACLPLSPRPCNHTFMTLHSSSSLVSSPSPPIPIPFHSARYEQHCLYLEPEIASLNSPDWNKFTSITFSLFQLIGNDRGETTFIPDNTCMQPWHTLLDSQADVLAWLYFNMFVNSLVSFWREICERVKLS